MIGKDLLEVKTSHLCAYNLPGNLFAVISNNMICSYFLSLSLSLSLSLQKFSVYVDLCSYVALTPVFVIAHNFKEYD